MSDEPKCLTATEIERRKKEFSQELAMILRRAHPNRMLIYADMTKCEREIRAINHKQVDWLIKMLDRMLQEPERDEE